MGKYLKHKTKPSDIIFHEILISSRICIQTGGSALSNTQNQYAYKLGQCNIAIASVNLCEAQFLKI